MRDSVEINKCLIKLHKELWLEIARRFARDKENSFTVLDYKTMVLNEMYYQDRPKVETELIKKAVFSSKCFACVYAKEVQYRQYVKTDNWSSCCNYCDYCPFEWDVKGKNKSELCSPCYESYYGTLVDKTDCYKSVVNDWKKCCKLAYKIAMLEWHCLSGKGNRKGVICCVD